MQKIHVILKKEELDPQRLAGKVVVVLDILFATSSMVTALAHGATEVIPVDGESAARATAAALVPGSYVLAGEWLAQTLPGFAHPTPLALLDHGVAERSLVYATTNGTVAVDRARGADRVYVAALLNADAVVRRVAAEHSESTVLLVCSGSVDRFNLEDFYGAGYLVSLLQALPGARCYTDAALAAQAVHRSLEAEDCLSASRVGRRMAARSRSDEVAFVARRSCYDIVPTLQGDSVRPL